MYYMPYTKVRKLSLSNKVALEKHTDNMLFNSVAIYTASQNCHKELDFAVTTSNYQMA